MNQLKFYSVSDRYIAYLSKHFPNVYSNKIDARTHTRKYIGVVLQINDHNYYVLYPLLNHPTINWQVLPM